ncbi:hypothetical protein CT0861_00295 [Colletotrichum tofieldiae]|uniref:Uncharacterized protein n=1 Tax=Colletotrichum tofieldiae TaxID=708197 RepID=A0A166SQJ8_9PEZI|nr:hypothetical protein CT0861_00295 [Colletotrichum tofieldiae]
MDGAWERKGGDKQGSVKPLKRDHEVIASARGGASKSLGSRAGAGSANVRLNVLPGGCVVRDLSNILGIARQSPFHLLGPRGFSARYAPRSLGLVAVVAYAGRRSPSLDCQAKLMLSDHLTMHVPTLSKLQAPVNRTEKVKFPPDSPKKPDEYLIETEAGRERGIDMSGREPHGHSEAHPHGGQDLLRQADSAYTQQVIHTTPTRQSDIVSLPCISMYHCDITWNTPDPSEDQRTLEHGPQYQQHQRQQSREHDEAVPTQTRTHSHTPQQQQQQQQHDHFGFVNLLVSNTRGQALRGSRFPFARDVLVSHHQEPSSNSSHGQRTSGQLRSISPPGTLAPYQRTLLSPPPTASSVSQSLQARTSSATPTRPCVSSSRRPFG